MADLPVHAPPVNQSEILHSDLIVYIGENLHPSMCEYQKFLISIRPYLSHADISHAKESQDPIGSIIDSLQTKCHITIGNYKRLVDILDKSGLINIKTEVEQKAVKIQEEIKRERDLTQADNHAVKESEAVAKLREKSDLFRSKCQHNTQDFVETTLYQQARQMIEDNNSLLILGGMGDGKSSIIQYIAAHAMGEYLPVSCTRAKEIDKYFSLVQGTSIKLLFVFDNSFGDSYKIQRNVDEWVTLGNQLTMFLTTHKLLIATRTAIWKDCETAVKKFQIFSNVVEISSSNLTRVDKRQLLRKYLKDKVEVVDVDKIVNEVKPIAFGQCCTLMQGFISKANYQQQQASVAEQVLQIFKKPFSFLRTELDAMAQNEKPKYATLCLVMLCGGKIECGELSGTKSDVTPNVRERMDVVVETCNVGNLQIGVFQDNANTLSGTYLQKNIKTSNHDGIYEFCHDSIREAVTMKYYGEHNFEHCLKYLDSAVVMNIVRPTNYQKGEQEFAINAPTAKYYREIAGMFTQKVIEAKGKGGMDDVCENPCVRDEHFQSVWIDYLTQASPQKLTDFCQSEDPGDRCVLYHLAKSGADKLVRYLYEHSVRKHLILTCNCRCEDRLACQIWGAVAGGQTKTFIDLLTAYTLNQSQVRQAVLQACRFDSDGVLNILLTSYTPSQDEVSLAVLAACMYGSVDVLNILLTSCTVSQDQVRQAVETACKSDSVDVLNALLTSYTVSQDQVSEAVETVCKHGRVGALKAILPHLHEDRVKTIKEGLRTACIYGRVSTVTYLLSEVCTQGDGDTCLCVEGLLTASRSGKTDIVRVILSSGHKANINVTNDCGVSSLHLSANWLHTGVVTELVKNGADVNFADKWGQTPIHAAMMRTDKLLWNRETDEEMRHKRRDVVETLLCHRPKVSMETDQWGRTALHLAVHRDYTDIVELFSHHGYKESSDLNRGWSEPNEQDLDNMEKAGYRRR